MQRNPNKRERKRDRKENTSAEIFSSVQILQSIMAEWVGRMDHRKGKQGAIPQMKIASVHPVINQQ